MENLPEAYKILIVIVSTTFLLIPAIIVLRRYEQRRKTKLIETIALSLHKMYRNLAVTDFELLPVNPANFRDLNFDFYESVSSILQQHQFRLIGDFEESHIKKTYPAVSFFSRFLLNENGTTKATIFELKGNASAFKTIEFTSELSDGRVVITSNNSLNAKMGYPEEIQFQFCDTASPIDLLQFHNDRIQDGHARVSIQNIDEIIEQHRRIKSKENLYRKSLDREGILKDMKGLLAGMASDQVFSKAADRVIELRVKRSSDLN